MEIKSSMLNTQCMCLYLRKTHENHLSGITGLAAGTSAAAAVLGRGEDERGELGRGDDGRGEVVRAGVVVRDDEDERSGAEAGVAWRCTMLARRAVVRGRLRSITALISALCLWATAADIARWTEASPLA